MNRRVLCVGGQVIDGALAIGCLLTLMLCAWCFLDVFSFGRNAQLIEGTIVGFSPPVTEEGSGRAPIVRVSLPSDQDKREEIVRLSGLYRVEADAVGRPVSVLYNPEHAIRFAID